MCTEEVAAESTTRRPKHRRQRLQSLVLLGQRGRGGVVPSAAAVMEVTAAWRLVVLVLEAAMSERALRIWHEPRFILWSFLMVLQPQI